LNNHQKAILLLVGSYLVDLIYTLVEWDFNTRQSFFPFFHGYDGWDGKMALGSYVYYYCQHIKMAMIYCAAYLVTGWRFITVLFWVELADLIDYILIYHEGWFTIGSFWIFEDIKFEFNYAKIFIVSIYAYFEWKKLKSLGNYSH
jgi:hypothetical protein